MRASTFSNGSTVAPLDALNLLVADTRWAAIERCETRRKER